VFGGAGGSLPIIETMRDDDARDITRIALCGLASAGFLLLVGTVLGAVAGIRALPVKFNWLYFVKIFQDRISGAYGEVEHSSF
jgi:hypothetical protein